MFRGFPGLPKLRRQAQLETLAIRLRVEQFAKRGLFLAVALLLAVLALVAALAGLIVWLSHGVGVVAACFIGAGSLLAVSLLIVAISGPASGRRTAEVAEQIARTGRRSRVREARRLSDIVTALLAGRRGGGKWGLLLALGVGFVAGLAQSGDGGDDIDDE